MSIPIGAIVLVTGRDWNPAIEPDPNGYSGIVVGDDGDYLVDLPLCPSGYGNALGGLWMMNSEELIRLDDDGDDPRGDPLPDPGRRREFVR